MFNFFYDTANFTLSVFAIPFMVLLVIVCCFAVYAITLYELFKLLMEMVRVGLQKLKNKRDDTSS